MRSFARFAGLAAIGLALAGRRPAAGRVSRTTDHPDRPVGGGRRHRRHRPDPRQHAGAGARRAGQRGQPHRRLGRGRPLGDRHRGARRLHARRGHGRDRHDALAGPDRADLRGLYAARAVQRGRRPGCRCAPTASGRRRRTCSMRSRPARASTSPRAPARAASGIWRSPACCRRPASPPTPRRGCRARARRPACRIWSRAASTSSPARCRRRRRCSRPGGSRASR